MTWALVAIGAAVGAPLRYLVERWVTEASVRRRGGRMFPWGLLVVNATGSALAGLVVARTTGDLRLLLLTGLCGAYTTFSGFAWATVRLFGEARWAAWLSVAVFPVACVGAFAVVWQLVR